MAKTKRCRYNPRLKKRATSARAREFVSKHIEHHIRDLKMPPVRAVRAAYEEARHAGFQIPRPNPATPFWKAFIIAKPKRKKKTATRANPRAYAIVRRQGKRVIRQGFSSPTMARAFLKSYLLILTRPGDEAWIYIPSKRQKIFLKKKSNPRKSRARANPVIGDEAISIVYRGGKGKRKSKRPWIHKFETPVKVLGRKDGSVVLKSTRGERLWGYF